MAIDNKKITFKNEPIEVTGTCLKVGDALPSFRVTGLDMADITNATFKGKVLCISVIPSIDTPVCQNQTRQFNERMSDFSDQVAVLTVSMDLPFAQKRWCGAEGVEFVTMGSDYKYHQFGEQFGVSLPKLGLLARAVFVADTNGKITYLEYVDEVSAEPNYEAAIAQIEKAL